MWSDNETETDYLGFQHLVSAIVSIVECDDLLPTTVGVFGDWGSGKSSLINIARAELEKKADTLVLAFNGWVFEGYEDTKAALMGTVLDEIKKRTKLGPKAEQLMKKLLKRVNWFRVLAFGAKHGLAFAAAGPVGLGLSATMDVASVASGLLNKAKDVDTEKLASLVHEDGATEVRQAVREFRDDFKSLLEETTVKKLVVIIDDLDRCNPDTIIETLEAIKLFLFVPHTAFIIGADERLVRYAVRRRFPELPGEKVEVGRDYLEKLVQFPIRVPQLGRAEMETYINVLFAQAAGLGEAEMGKVQECATKCDKKSLLEVRFNRGIAQAVLGNLDRKVEENLDLAQRIGPVLVDGLNGNPRQCKRFLNTLVIRVGMANSRGIELSSGVLAKLMLLEHFRPETFRALGGLSAEQGGGVAELRFLEEAAKPPVQAKGERGAKGDGRKEKTREKGEETQGRQEREDRSEVMENSLFVQTCLSDGWTKRWLQSEPPLSGEDLRPYFYFSRDRLGSLGGVAQRLSPAAQQVLAELFSESEAIRLRTVKNARELGPADATAVLDALTERARMEDDSGAEDSAMARIFDWVRERPELFSQLISFLNDVSEARFTPAYALRLKKLATGEAEQRLAGSILMRWSQSTANTRLAAAAKQAMSTHSM